MSRRAFIIFMDPVHARVCRAGERPESADIAAAPGATPQQLADAAFAALSSLGYAGEGLVLAVPSAWCLCAAVRLDDLPPRSGRQAMIFRLEEKLPVSAEDVVADLAPSNDGEAALGVCVEKKTLAPLVESLERRGIAVEAICPASLLALQHLLSDMHEADALVWPAGDGSLELFTLRGGTPRSWTLLPDEPGDLLLHVELAPRDRSMGMNFVALGLRKPLLDALAGLHNVRVIERETVHPDEAAAAMARAVLAGEAEAWVNLRRDELAVRDRVRLVHTSLAFAAAAMTLCLVSLSGTMLWRAHRYGRLAAAYADQQQAAFRRVFPEQPVPMDVSSRLASEARALRGVSGDASAPPPDAPGLLALRDLITRLPPGVRFRLLDLRLDPGRFTIEGQALSHGDADAIVGALRNHPAFDVEPPRTEQMADAPGENAMAVSFTITGSVATQREGKAARGATE
jgi:hypothetical protein